MGAILRLSAVVLVSAAWCGALDQSAVLSRMHELQALRGCKDVAGTPVGITDIRCTADTQNVQVLTYGSPESLCAPQPSPEVRCNHGAPLTMQLKSNQPICICVADGKKGMPSGLAIGVPSASVVVRGTIGTPEDAVRLLQLAEVLAGPREHH